MKPLFTSAFTLFLLMGLCLFTYAQDSLYRDFKALRINEAPKIDGILDEAVWMENPNVRTEYFIQLEPDNGARASYPTEVHITYNDAAIYVAMRLFDPAPDSIPRELGMRDDFGRNADQVLIAFDTYGNGQNAFGFGLTSAGVQLDLSLQAQGEDTNWDAVWNSAVGFEDGAWIVEMEIPYMALRFPKKEVQSWKMNILRTIKRKNERSFYSFVDNSQSGLINQFTPLKGLENIKPPLRLSLTPFVTSYLTYDQASGNSRTFLTGGMDLKYGINESFTLDMSLIPDFGQVQSDNVVLNLSPFEVRFDENRPFFTEGTELFDKGGLFYSRRVGKTFGIFEPELAEEEVLTTYPNDAPLLNASKVSGRTKGGLGVGLFNSVTNSSYAKVKNTETGAEREVMIDPLTNFNVFVLDQNLKNNSNISLINTNVRRADGGRDANVTGVDFRLQDSTNTYRISGFGAISHLSDGGMAGDTGYKYNVSLGKVSGKYQYKAGRNVESHNYNPNDLGFLRAPNKIEHFGRASYNLFKPWWKFNRLDYSVRLGHSQLYKPREFVNMNVSNNLFAQLKNFWMFEVGSGYNPLGYHDYFEARVTDRVFIKPAAYDVFMWMQTDNRKRLSFSANLGTFQVPEWNSHSRWIGFSPRFRVSDRLSINHSLSLNREKGDRGFVKHLYEEEQLQHIVMGRRDVQTVSNTLTTRYTFNNKMGLSLRVRHYWSKVNYDKFFSLRTDGKLDALDYTGRDEEGNPLHNTSFNAFNVDLVYQWQIGPGSFVNVVWKDAVFTNNNRVDQNYMENFNGTLASDHSHNLSVKLIYFIDYLRVKNSLGME
jgi:hypothetical protein